MLWKTWWEFIVIRGKEKAFELVCWLRSSIFGLCEFCFWLCLVRYLKAEGLKGCF